MIRMQTWNIFALLSLVMVYSCSTSESPQQVVQSFWDAARLNNEASAQELSTEDSRLLIDFSQHPSRHTSIHEGCDSIATLGKVVILDDRAIVDTQCTFKSTVQGDAISFQTHLLLENNTWKVNYAKTIETLPVSHKNNGLSDLLEKIEQINKKFAEKYRESLSGLKKEIPRIEQDMKNLTDDIKKEIEKKWRQHGSKAVNVFDRLYQQFDELVRKLQEENKERGTDEEIRNSI